MNILKALQQIGSKSISNDRPRPISRYSHKRKRLSVLALHGVNPQYNSHTQREAP